MQLPPERRLYILRTLLGLVKKDVTDVLLSNGHQIRNADSTRIANSLREEKLTPRQRQLLETAERALHSRQNKLDLAALEIDEYDKRHALDGQEAESTPDYDD